MIDEKYYTVQELADLLRVKRRTVYRWIREKTIGVTRFGRREIRFSEDQVKAFLQVRNVGEKPVDIWAKEPPA